ncbi:MAG: hypothetical protein IJV04_00985 [Lachnospiraceae bacterium]|nr:hypothetical protein [Lachnospiraceae bacterium]
MKKWVQIAAVAVFFAALLLVVLNTPRLKTDARTFAGPPDTGEEAQPDYTAMDEKEILVLAYD